MPAARPVLAAVASAGVVLAITLVGDAPPSGLSGSVVDPAGQPIAGATVRVKATAISTVTDALGRFTLAVPGGARSVRATASRPGYYVGGGEPIAVGTVDATLVLRELPERDDGSYAWLPSTGDGELACARCHASGVGPAAAPADALPVDQWLLDAHSQSVRNVRFLTMYLGRDVSGRQSPPTRYAWNRDYGRVPLAPDPSAAYYGPGYRLDFPGTDGNCATCHAPVAALDDPFRSDPTLVTGVAAEGMPCDLCHKVVGVALDPLTRLPSTARPGVLSIDLRRPPPGEQLFTGPLDDVAPGDDAVAPVLRESAFCAACHFGVFWDTVVYDSYGEWLRSPWSDPSTGKTCQDCHMAPTGATRFAREAAGGEARDPATIFGHQMPGASDVALLQDAVTMTATAQRDGDVLRVNVTITNDRTGHHVPTDSPLRHVVLLVRARTFAGADLVQLAGPTLPSWVGAGQGEGAAAGMPGTVYAKVLKEAWTGTSPTGAYWNPTRIVRDNRLAAFASDETRYAFAARSGPARVEVVLLYRRAFASLVAQKGWDVADVEMERLVVEIPG